MSDRERAIQEGRKFYIGKKPHHCGCVVKYVSTYGCHYCVKKEGYEKLMTGELKKYQTPEKMNKKQKRWRGENPDKVKQQYLRHSINRNGYQITEEQYYDKLEEQNGKCAICNSECDKGRLAIDHDHKTNKVRGLLCRQCNLGLGNFSDNLDKLEAAVLYLRKYGSEK